MRKRIHHFGHVRRIRRRFLHLEPQPVGLGVQRPHVVPRRCVERQGEQLVRGGAQAIVEARVHLEQIGVADDLVEPRGALEGADFLEHHLIVAGPLHAVHHQLLAAVRQPVHLHRGVDRGEQQGCRHDGETDEHEAAQ